MRAGSVCYFRRVTKCRCTACVIFPLPWTGRRANIINLQRLRRFLQSLLRPRRLLQVLLMTGVAQLVVNYGWDIIHTKLARLRPRARPLELAGDHRVHKRIRIGSSVRTRARLAGQAAAQIPLAGRTVACVADATERHLWWMHLLPPHQPNRGIYNTHSPNHWACRVDMRANTVMRICPVKPFVPQQRHEKHSRL